MQKKKLIPPDGGWGWVIVFAYALNHLLLIPIMQSFGLLFKDTFKNLGFSATDGSIIINSNAAGSMLTGLINGPLLKYFGYRKVSYASAFFSVLGIICTAYSNSFATFLISYGLITSLGMGMGMSSYPLALNTYFLKLRSKAAGITMTITGLGPVLMPQLISLLLYLHDIKGAMLIIAGISAHAFIAASLLQPVKIHMKEEIVDEEEEAGGEKEDDSDKNLIKAESTGLYDKNNPVIQSFISIDHDMEVQAIYGFDTPLNGSVMSLNTVPKQRKYSVASYKSVAEGKVPFARSDSETKDEKMEISEDLPQKKKKKVSLCTRICSKLVNIFDLTLLKDPIYVNIMLGMSLAVFAELNFSIMTPFILSDFNLTTYQSATFLSVLSIADIVFRFLSPFIGDFLNRPARIMYMVSLVLLISTRFTLLLFSETYTELLCVAVGLGIAKGIRTVYWTLVIPNYVPIERLANASGIQMVVNGIFILIGGPLLGVIRDISGNYKNCIYAMNMVTSMTLIMWTTELLYLKYRKPKNTTKKPLP